MSDTETSAKHREVGADVLNGSPPNQRVVADSVSSLSPDLLSDKDLDERVELGSPHADGDKVEEFCDPGRLGSPNTKEGKEEKQLDCSGGFESPRADEGKAEELDDTVGFGSPHADEGEKEEYLDSAVGVGSPNADKDEEEELADAVGFDSPDSDKSEEEQYLDSGVGLGSPGADKSEGEQYLDSSVGLGSPGADASEEEQYLDSSVGLGSPDPQECEEERLDDAVGFDLSGVDDGEEEESLDGIVGLGSPNIDQDEEEKSDDAIGFCSHDADESETEDLNSAVGFDFPRAGGSENDECANEETSGGYDLQHNEDLDGSERLAQPHVSTKAEGQIDGLATSVKNEPTGHVSRLPAMQLSVLSDSPDIGDALQQTLVAHQYASGALSRNRDRGDLAMSSANRISLVSRNSADCPSNDFSRPSSAVTLIPLEEHQSACGCSLDQSMDSVHHATRSRQISPDDAILSPSLKGSDGNVGRRRVAPNPSSTENARAALPKTDAHTPKTANKLTQAKGGKKGLTKQASPIMYVRAVAKRELLDSPRGPRMPGTIAGTVSKLQAKSKTRAVIPKTRAQNRPKQVARTIPKSGRSPLYTGKRIPLTNSPFASSLRTENYSVAASDGTLSCSGFALQSFGVDGPPRVTPDASFGMDPAQAQLSSTLQGSDRSESGSPQSQSLADANSINVNLTEQRPSLRHGSSFASLRGKKEKTANAQLNAARIVASCLRCLRAQLQFDQYKCRAVALREARLHEEMNINAALLESSCAVVRDFLSFHVRPRMKWLAIRRALKLFRVVIARTPVVRRKRVLNDKPWLMTSIGTSRAFTREERQRAVLFNASWCGVGGYVPVSVQVCRENLREALPRGYVKPLRDLALRQERLVDVNFCLSTCVCLTESGMVYCFGSNLLSECGRTNRAVNVSPGLPLHFHMHKVRIVKVSTGAAHAVALSDAGAVFAWGHNALGSCGVGASTNKLVDEPRRVIFRVARKSLAAKDHIPVHPRETEVVSISCGKRSTTAITRSRGIWLWGDRKSIPFPCLRITDRNDIPVLVWGAKQSKNASQQYPFRVSNQASWESDAARVTMQYTRTSEMPRATTQGILKTPHSNIRNLFRYDDDLRTKHLFEPVEALVLSFRLRKEGYTHLNFRCNAQHKHCSPTAISVRAEWILELSTVPCFKEIYTTNHGIACISRSGRIYASGKVNGLRNPDLETRGLVYRVPQFRLRMPIKSIAISSRHCLALAESGKVLCWGMLEFFSMKTNMYCEQVVSKVFPVMHQLFQNATIASIHCSMFHCAVRFVDKRVFAWHFADWSGEFFRPALFQYSLAPAAERICYAGETFNAFFAEFDKPAESNVTRTMKSLRKGGPAQKVGYMQPFTPSQRRI